MAKFVIRCPHCGTCNTASTSFFSKNVIECTCGNLINVKKDRMRSIECPHCKNTVVYDQAEGTKAICPVCKNRLVSDSSLKAVADINCPSCSCKLTVDKNLKSYECPLCETKIDVQAQIKKAEIKSDGAIAIIKYEGSNDIFVWKHPIEDFNYGSQLIVHESQEAVFFKDGKALDLFGAGRHTLMTGNMPLLKSTFKLATGGKNLFHSEVYFVNLTTQMGIKWGTDSKIRLFDPASGLHVEIGACGQFNIRVIDSRKLLLKIVGTAQVMQQNELLGSDYSFKAMAGKFKALVMTKVKSLLAKAIRELNISILEVDEHIEDLSLILKNSINTTLEEYGLTMPEFFITTILTPDDDPNFKRMKEQYAARYLLIQEERIKKAEAEAAQQRKIVEAQTQAQEEIIAAQAKAQAYKIQAEAEAEEMKMKGYTYQQETQRKVASAAVSNVPTGNGSGDMSGMIGGMVNLGVGLGVMGEVVNTVKGAVNPAINQTLDSTKKTEEQNASTWECPNCHFKATTPFCPQCGTKKVVELSGWNCSCGQKNIMTPFCPQCGAKREEMCWNCSCGQENITTPFCPNCGKKKGE